MTLTEFLLARIAEDEAVAREASPGPWYADDTYATVTSHPFKSAREAYDRDRLVEDVDCWVIPESMDSGVGSHNLTHIARHDPARVLADCEGRRAIVEECRWLIDSFGDWDAESGAVQMWTDVNRRERSQAHGRLHTLAAVYADHPDYDEAWKP